MFEDVIRMIFSNLLKAELIHSEEFEGYVKHCTKRIGKYNHNDYIRFDSSPMAGYSVFVYCEIDNGIVRLDITKPSKQFRELFSVSIQCDKERGTYALNRLVFEKSWYKPHQQRIFESFVENVSNRNKISGIRLAYMLHNVIKPFEYDNYIKTLTDFKYRVRHALQQTVKIQNLLSGR